MKKSKLIETTYRKKAKKRGKAQKKFGPKQQKPKKYVGQGR
jgi:hypothetical protein